jgi:hypothetical protein
MTAFPADLIREVDTWLDDNASQRYQPDTLGDSTAQDWARLSKVSEELGEAISVLIGITGQNPRKGYHGTPEEFLNEICDIITTGILCLQHFTKDTQRTEQLIEDRWTHLFRRMELTRDHHR